MTHKARLRGLTPIVSSSQPAKAGFVSCKDSRRGFNRRRPFARASKAAVHAAVAK